MQGIYRIVAKRKKKKSTNSTKKILVTLIILSVLSVTANYGIKFFNKAKFVHYDGFGIDMPVNYEIHGIDVSKHQSEIAWDDVKAMQIKNIKIGFGFIKATEGIRNVDGQFENNWQEAGRTHITRGAYHFFNPSKSGKAQARNFIETVKLSKGDLPPVLDVEQLNSTTVIKLQQGVKEWLTTVEAHYHVKPIIYTNATFYTNILGKQFDDYPLWVVSFCLW